MLDVFVYCLILYLCLNWLVDLARGWCYDLKTTTKTLAILKGYKTFSYKNVCLMFLYIYVLFYIWVRTNLVDWTRGWFYENKCAFLYDSAWSRCPDVALCGLQEVQIQLLTRSLTHAWSRCPDVARVYRKLNSNCSLGHSLTLDRVVVMSPCAVYKTLKYNCSLIHSLTLDRDWQDVKKSTY